MKKIILLSLLVAITAAHTGCDPRSVNDRLPALKASSLDQDGGDWHTILISAPSVISIPTPSIGTDYDREINQTRTLMENRTSTQDQAIEYWSSGGVLRWNQIARQLVTKYNVRPEANKPTPKPLAHAPFAARAYALLSVAQYDALVTCWYYKNYHKRPNLAHSGLKGILPESDFYSYPSEDAAVAAVSFRVLAYLFPDEVDFLYQKAIEHGNTKIWAGMCTQSDVAAGGQIGQQVAKNVLLYAKNDRYHLADDPYDTWKKIQVDINWKSLDKPERRPIGALAGQVKTWLDSARVYAATPPPPPPVGSAEFQKALEEVRAITDKRTDDQTAITWKWADNVGTANPAGHWNLVAEELIRKANFSEIRTARTLAILNMALHDAAVLCWFTKYKYYFPRPAQFDPKINLVMKTPSFPSYTSGHSTFSGAGSTVLSYIFPEVKDKLDQMAEEAGMSRIYGGIHYSFDNTEGQKSGRAIGALAVEKAKTDGASSELK
jgi:membrane-associated phospholipid phosphatase